MYFCSNEKKNAASLVQKNDMLAILQKGFVYLNHQFENINFKILLVIIKNKLGITNEFGKISNKR